ncbi:MAG: PD-(D/E)XK nuclease family protein [Anaerolineae bacterium]|jgi:hypothetical protein|nr:PD-(D/E)XK nuclease family protein [Anaerolineae bacterium]MDH7475325.1 PD-(D/E)XK nuclease family protein [Anaerolineae bacterium]
MTSPEITVYATNKNFLNVYDCLEIGKVKFEVASYDPDTRKQTGRAYAYVDVDKVRLLIHACKHGQFGKLLEGKFEDFGGSEVDGRLQSRIFTVEYDPGEDGKFARFPIRLTIANGPGKRNRQGGVMPDGQPAVTCEDRDPAEIAEETFEMLRAYLRGPAREIKPALVETCFEFRLDGIPVPFVAYVDVVTVDGIIIDHKTSGGNGWSQDKADADQQVDAYWLAYTMRFGCQPKGFCFHVIAPPKISEPAEVKRIREKNRSVALEEQREIVELGDFYFVESGEDNLSALPCRERCSP